MTVCQCGSIEVYYLLVGLIMYLFMEYYDLARVLPKKTITWSVSDVSIWLEFINMAILFPRFRNQSIDGSCIKLLDEKDLEEMKISSKWSKNKLMQWVNTKFSEYDQYLECSWGKQKYSEEATSVSMNKRAAGCVTGSPSQHWAKPEGRGRLSSSGTKLPKVFDGFDTIIGQPKRQFEEERRAQDLIATIGMYNEMREPRRKTDFKLRLRTENQRYEESPQLMTYSNTQTSKNPRTPIMIHDTSRGVCIEINKDPFMIGTGPNANYRIESSCLQDQMVVMRRCYNSDLKYNVRALSHGCLLKNEKKSIVLTHRMKVLTKYFYIGGNFYQIELIPGFIPKLQFTCIEDAGDQQKMHASKMTIHESTVLLASNTAARSCSKDKTHPLSTGEHILGTIAPDREDLSKFTLIPHKYDIWIPMDPNREYEITFGNSIMIDKRVVDFELANSMESISQYCIICQTEKKDCVLMDCKHNSCCIRCSWSLLKCPICRSPIRECIRIYEK